MTGPAAPRPRPSFYAHVVVDVTTDPPTQVDIRMLRSEARKIIEHSPDADSLRIRRVRCQMFQS